MIKIEKIKDELTQNKGKKKHFLFKGNRGQIDEYDGIILNTYQGIFTVKSSSDNRLKSYSYSDILIENLVVK